MLHVVDDVIEDALAPGTLGVAVVVLPETRDPLAALLHSPDALAEGRDVLQEAH